MKITIECTEKHLQDSLMSQDLEGARTKTCWIAMAVREIFPEAHIGSAALIFHRSNEFNNVELPKEAQETIRRFDNFLDVSFSMNTKRELWDLLTPFSFDIDINEKNLNFISQVYNYNLREIYDILETSETLTLKSV